MGKAMAESLNSYAERFDVWQHRRKTTAFAIAVLKKYVDDRGTNIAATLSYHAFVAVAPLLLVFFTILGLVLPRDARLSRAITTSTLNDFPVIGQSLRSPTLHGEFWAVVVGLLIALWGATGITRTFQWAMADIWNVPGKDRGDFVPRQIRGVVLLSLLTVGVAATTLLNSLGDLLDLDTWGNIVRAIPGTGVDIGLIYISFYVLTPGSPRRRDLLPGALIAGIGIELLQTAGVSLFLDQAKRASEFYQTFGVVVGFLAFVYFSAQIVIFAAEFNVVRAEKLWPRNMEQPPFTQADLRQLAFIAKREERAHGITVSMHVSPETARNDPAGASDARGSAGAAGSSGPAGDTGASGDAGARGDGVERRLPNDKGRATPQGRVVER